MLGRKYTIKKRQKKSRVHSAMHPSSKKVIYFLLLLRVEDSRPKRPEKCFFIFFFFLLLPFFISYTVAAAKKIRHPRSHSRHHFFFLLIFFFCLSQVSLPSGSKTAGGDKDTKTIGGGPFILLHHYFTKYESCLIMPSLN